MSVIIHFHESASPPKETAAPAGIVARIHFHESASPSITAFEPMSTSASQNPAHSKTPRRSPEEWEAPDFTGLSLEGRTYVTTVCTKTMRCPRPNFSKGVFQNAARSGRVASLGIQSLRCGMRSYFPARTGAAFVRMAERGRNCGAVPWVTP